MLPGKASGSGLAGAGVGTTLFGPTVPQVSRGEHDVWPEFDWGGIDDVGILWWDPTATGPDEVGAEGTEVEWDPSRRLGRIDVHEHASLPEERQVRLRRARSHGVLHDLDVHVAVRDDARLLIVADDVVLDRDLGPARSVIADGSREGGG